MAGAEIYQIAIKDKLMKNKLMLLFCVLPVIGAEPAGYKYWSAAELKGFATKLAPKVNAQKFASERLTDYRQSLHDGGAPGGQRRGRIPRNRVGSFCGYVRQRQH